jgi:hypothetical protein
VAGGNQEQAVGILARTHMGSGQQALALSRVQSDLKRPRMQEKKWTLINKDASNKNNDNNKNAKATHLPGPTIKQKEAIIKTYKLGDKAEHLMYTNQAGRFPKTSSQGHQYNMVLLEIDSNAILVEAMKNCTASKMIRAYHKYCRCSPAITPKMHILYNEPAAEFKERIMLNNMKYRLDPPHNHRKNTAEKAIQSTLDKYLS